MFSSRRAFAAIVAACVTALLLAAAAVARPAAPAAASSRNVMVWLPYWSISTGLTSTLDNADLIGAASPYWYEIEGAATVQETPGGVDDDAVTQLRDRGIKVVPMVTEDAGLTAFARILRSPAKRAAMVHALVRIATSAEYAGIDLDFENMATDKQHKTGPANQIAALYPKLVSEACAALHAVHRLCELTAMPRTSSAHVYWHGELATWVYDYAALARAADRVQVMAYDEHDPVGGAGPVAGLDWVKRTLAYATGQMPADRIELGVPAYGYDWTGPKQATTLTAVQAAALARQQHAHVHYYAATDEATFTYRQDGQRHTVWFEDATTDLDRAKLATADHLAGIAVWAAGDEQPALWKLLGGLR